MTGKKTTVLGHLPQVKLGVDHASVRKPAGYVPPPAEHLHPLYPVLLAAITQAMHGKGERHGGASTPFLEQPWRHYAQLHGRGFLTGQAAKKLEEAASRLTGEAFEQEVLGAIVYAGMALLWEREKQA